jgi:hypothetical protein
MNLKIFTASILSVLANPVMAMTLGSDDIAAGAAISRAQIYPRCGGGNISPELHWSGAPAGTKSFALTMIDTSVAPAQWSHWIVVGLPPGTTALARGVKALPAGAKQLQSNFGEARYDGPCPPKGTGIHRYEFTVWALPVATTPLVPGTKATDLSAELSTLALDHASLAGFVAP